MSEKRFEQSGIKWSFAEYKAFLSDAALYCMDSGNDERASVYFDAWREMDRLFSEWLGGVSEYEVVA